MGKFAKNLAVKALNLVPNMFGWNLVPIKLQNSSKFVFDSYMLSAYWNSEPEVVAYDVSIRKVDNLWSDNISKRCRYFSLYQNMMSALDRNWGMGDVAECGVWKGHSAHMLATILKSRGFSGKFQIFDSFEGLSELTHNDLNERFTMNDEQANAQKDILTCSEDIVRANLAEFDFMQYFPGWIPSRFPDVSDSTYILVHIDVDLYQPYRDAIEFFFPRLVDGGILAFDDYGLTQFPGAKTAIDEAVAALAPSHFYKIPTGGAFLIK